MLNLDKTNTVKDKNEILNQIKNLTYKDTKILVKFIGDQGKILPFFTKCLIKYIN